MFSRRGQLIVLSGVFFLTSGFAFINYYLVLLGIFLILVSIIGLPFFKISTFIENLEVERKVDRTKVFARDFFHVKISVRNKGNKKIDFLEVYDVFPETFVLAIGKNKIATRLDPQTDMKFSYVLQPRLRGQYNIGPTKLVIHDRLRFNYDEKTIGEYTELLVYPSYQDVRRMSALARKRALGIMFGIHRAKDKGVGTDFVGIRRYMPTDEIRWIDWKATAKTGKFMSREFETERNIKIVVFLDTSGSMGAGEPENSKLEYSVRAAVLLAHLGLERRDEVGLLTFSNRVWDYIEPKSGKTQFYKILDVLARVQSMGRSEPMRAVKHVLTHLKKTALFIMLTDLETTTNFVNAVKIARSSKCETLVISPVGPWFEIKMEELAPVEKALAEAIAEEFLSKRQKVARELRKMDVSVIDVGPDDYLPAVVSQYLKAKKRGVAVY